MTTNSKIHAALAIGCLLAFGIFVAFLPPVPPASAQSQAERICREQGVKLNSEGYEYCLSQGTRAVEWGEPALARSFARVTTESREACLSYGLKPQTTSFKECIDKETLARGRLVYADEQPSYGPQLANHP